MLKIWKALAIVLAVLIICNCLIAEQGKTIKENTIPDNKIDQLVIALKDKNPEISEQAAKELSKIGTPAVAVLIEALKYDKYDKEDIPRKEYFVDNKNDRADVRWRAADALGEIGDIRAVEPLCVALDDEDGQVSLSAIEALAKIGDARAVPCLVAAFENKWVVLRKKAADTLAQFGWKPKNEQERIAYVVSIQNWDECVKIGEPVVERLVSTFGILDTSNAGYDWPVSRAIADTLAKIGKPAAKPLIGTLKKQYNTYSQIDQAILKMGEPAVEVLIEALKDTDPLFRSDAARLLGKIGDTRAVQPLIDTLKDNSVPFYNEKVIDSLAFFRDKRAVKPLIALLEDNLTMHELKNVRFRSKVAFALGKIGDSTAVFPLINALKDEDYLLRGEAAKALGMIGDTNAVEPLISALNDEKEFVRSSVIRALGTLKGDRAFEILLPLLNDASFRSGAATALGDLGDKRAVEPLIRLLNDKDKHVRAKAATALGRIKDNRAVEPLIISLKDDAYEVRLSTVIALGNIGDKRAIEPLTGALKDREWIVPKCALESLQKLGWQAGDKKSN